ncbi:MAG: DUF2283 domain-containing protein [Chitinophagales bacterium]
MKIKYDKEVDVLYIRLSDEPVAESDEAKPGIIIDYSSQSNIVGIEILNASRKTISPAKLEYEVA